LVVELNRSILFSNCEQSHAVQVLGEKLTNQWLNHVHNSRQPLATVQNYDEENLSIDLFLKPHWLYSQPVEGTEYELLVG
jgi:hypothetical protein